MNQSARRPRPPDWTDRWEALDTPALLVDLDRLERNIARMAGLARDAGLALRPHFKAHKSVAIARRQLDAGAIGMTVAKLDEAEVLADAGVPDVLLAYELVTPDKIRRALGLARRTRLCVAVDDPIGVAALSASASAAGVEMDVVIEIDSGLHRCGVLPVDAPALALRIAQATGLRLVGVFTHGGHAYSAADEGELQTAAADEARSVVDAARRLRKAGVEVSRVSVGSTPTAAISARLARQPGFAGLTELRPGNYVFNDGIQVSLGVATAEDCALSVAATVISRPTADRAVIDCGSKTLGLDRGAHATARLEHFGEVVGMSARLARLSEEHGVLAVPPELALAVGDRVRILPNHACTVGNLGRAFHGIRDGRVVEELKIDAAGGVH